MRPADEEKAIAKAALAFDVVINPNKVSYGEKALRDLFDAAFWLGFKDGSSDEDAWMYSSAGLS
jgi:hypothetical protein